MGADALTEAGVTEAGGEAGLSLPLGGLLVEPSSGADTRCSEREDEDLEFGFEFEPGVKFETGFCLLPAPIRQSGPLSLPERSGRLLCPPRFPFLFPGGADWESHAAGSFLEEEEMEGEEVGEQGVGENFSSTLGLNPGLPGTALGEMASPLPSLAGLESSVLGRLASLAPPVAAAGTAAPPVFKGWAPGLRGFPLEDLEGGQVAISWASFSVTVGAPFRSGARSLGPSCKGRPGCGQAGLGVQSRGSEGRGVAGGHFDAAPLPSPSDGRWFAGSPEEGVSVLVSAFLASFGGPRLAAWQGDSVSGGAGDRLWFEGGLPPSSPGGLAGPPLAPLPPRGCLAGAEALKAGRQT